MPPPAFTLHPYRPSACEGVRQVMGFDEFARPELARRYPRMADYLADDMSHYVEFEPESVFVQTLLGAKQRMGRPGRRVPSAARETPIR